MNRLLMLGRRRLAANRLNVPFARASSFAIPPSIRLGGAESSLYLPQEDGVRTAFVEILLDDCYSLRVLRKKSIKTIIDIGANVGLFGLAARNTFPRAIIHAYEPNQSLLPFLAHQAGEGDFEYFLEAVGREAGRVSLELSGTESVLTSSRRDPNGAIPQVALGTTIKRIGGSVDLLKIDCEGAEWEMLEEIRPWQAVRFVAMEYHMHALHGHDRIRNALARCGFRIIRQQPAQGYGLILAENVGTGRGQAGS